MQSSLGMMGVSWAGVGTPRRAAGPRRVRIQVGGIAFRALLVAWAAAWVALAALSALTTSAGVDVARGSAFTLSLLAIVALTWFKPGPGGLVMALAGVASAGVLPVEMVTTLSLPAVVLGLAAPAFGPALRPAF